MRFLRLQNWNNKRNNRILAAGLCVSFLLGSLTGCKTSTYEPIAATESKVADVDAPVQGEVSWDAKWIWGDFNENDSWLMARKTFTLEEVPSGEPVYADISCDSKYWLYINGQTVVRDGCLKRGQTPTSVYYDSVDVSSYLQTGENSIALLVWYWGTDVALSYRTSGHGGMLFQMDAGNNHIISDESWSVRRDDAFDNTHNLSNERLPESDIYYLAENALEGWQNPSYEESGEDWKSAVVLADAGADPWGELVRRDIPMFYNSDELAYENAWDMPWKEEAYTTKKAETFSMELPCNMQVYPMLSVEAEEGLEIKISSDMYEDAFGNSVMTTYVTRDGKQSFETPGWMNGEHITYEIPEGVTVYGLTYRETGYRADISGSFLCDDDFYNELWDKSARSVYINMRDTYTDCPNRERVCWIGDLGLEALVSMYSMSPSALDLYKSSMKMILGNREQTFLWTVNPNTRQTEFMLQTLMMSPTIYEYYLATGDDELIKEAYEPLCIFLTNWTENEKGLYDCTVNFPYHIWGDSTENADYWALENAWLCNTFSVMEQMASVIGKEDEAKEFCKKKESLQEAYRKEYWTKEGYRSEWVKEPDDRANAVAVLAGIATEDQYDTIAKILKKKSNATPFLEYYVECACCEMGRMDIAQDRMKKRYGVMINAKGEKDTSTLWEYFNYKEGTSNHGWSAGPLVVMERYMMGIRPTEPGYRAYEISPDMGELQEMATSFETINGTIKVSLSNSKKSGYEMQISQPEGMSVRVAVKKTSKNPVVLVNGQDVFASGSAIDYKGNDVTVTYVSEDEEQIYFDILGEQIEVISK